MPGRHQHFARPLFAATCVPPLVRRQLYGGCVAGGCRLDGCRFDGFSFGGFPFGGFPLGGRHGGERPIRCDASFRRMYKLKGRFDDDPV